MPLVRTLGREGGALLLQLGSLSIRIEIRRVHGRLRVTVTAPAEVQIHCDPLSQQEK